MIDPVMREALAKGFVDYLREIAAVLSPEEEAKAISIGASDIPDGDFKKALKDLLIKHHPR